MGNTCIVAVGGGQINHRDPDCDTLAIDREIVRVADGTPPRLLFMPTASSDNQEYVLDVRAHFGRLGCDIRVMETASLRPSKNELESLVAWSTIIYVGGGDGPLLMRRLADLGLGPILAEAYTRGAVLSGLSAGAMCWFAFRPKGSQPGVPDIVARHGLGLIETTVCPHFDSQPGLREEFWRNIQPGRVGIGLYDCAAIRIRDARYDIITSKPTARAVLCRWEGDTRVQRELHDGDTGSTGELVFGCAPSPYGG